MVLFDTGPLGTGSLFRKPERIIEAWQACDVSRAFAEMEAARADGKWLAGNVAYELGYALIPKLARLMSGGCSEPLLRFGVFGQVEPAIRPGHGAGICLGAPRPSWSFEEYSRAFDIVQGYLRSGDIYQANLTFPITMSYAGDPLRLYDGLRLSHPVPHGAYVDLGEVKLLSRSPELFFSLSADGTISARPMKGTIRRGGNDAEDAVFKRALAQSEKDQAENLMITDLLRNDIGRLAEIGSVKVPKLFDIETYATVHQMVSEVTAQLRHEYGLADLFAALFPCGSITGAPKIRAMEILAGLEDEPRGSYCGSIGWIAPSGAMEFNVAIRTLICDGTERARLNVGGGVVYDSTPEGEYEEALLKARFAQIP
jgi:para-aminobenzoate synthetase component 1